MVEIMKQGAPYKERRMQIGCPRCLSHMRFRGDEVIEGVTFSYIVCPVCLAAGEEGWINVAKAEPYG